jgi:hypothetical protein
MSRRLSRLTLGLAAAAAVALGASASKALASGACCTGGSCSVVADAASCGGFYLGDGTTCTSGVCDVGGCVINPLNTQTCVSVTQAECQLQEGQWLGAGVTCASVLVNGLYTPPAGGQVNISGATLFNNFFTVAASTNDYLNIDGDNIYCRSPMPSGPVTDTGAPYVGFTDNDCVAGIDSTDQLAPAICPVGAGYWGQWIVQMRSVGSVEGFIEFIDNQLLGTFDYSVPSQIGTVNRTTWASGGSTVATCRAVADCNPGSGTANDSGTPVCPNSIDLAVTDVPSSYASVGTGTSTDAQWDKKPTTTGYGRNSQLSNPNSGLNVGYQMASLDRPPTGSLNLNVAAPNANTLFDSPVAWVPIAFMANRGTGLQDVRYTQLQHLYATGRLPNGENLIGSTRDSGSGTKNASMNSLGIDPSWGRGDNFGPRINITSDSNLGLSIATHAPPLADIRGKRTQATNCGGSGQIRNATQVFRLAVGYTGLAGSGSASTDAAAGNYEILNLCKDVDASGVAIPGYGCPAQACDGGPQPSANGLIPRHPGCPAPPANLTQSNNGFVRPNLFTVLDNSNGLCGYQIGGLETFISRGDPRSGVGAGPLLPPTANPAMSNLAARDYLRNILASVAGFVPTGSPVDFNMPGQYLANNFTLGNGVDAQPVLNPTDFVPTPGFDQTLQNYIRCNNVLDVKAFGTIDTAGKVPTRNSLSGATMPPFLFLAYSDGSIDGRYDNGTGALTIAAGQHLNQRNRIAGDFNYDLARNTSDISEMLKALANPRQYEGDEFNASPTGVAPLPDPLSPGNGGAFGTGMGGRNFAIPEIIGDYNGDGNFNAQDIRYFADGLAIDTNCGRLNRRLGWINVDAAWLAQKGTAYQIAGARPEYAGAQPPWQPTLPAYLPAWPDVHVQGAAVADIAGSLASPGGEPTGQDGIVNGLDIDYVYQNFGDFTNLRYDAVSMDLSADMNGDLKVDDLDVQVVVFEVLGTHFGDANLDGVVNGADLAIVGGNIGLPGGWAQGDFNGDGIVNAADLAIVNANLGATSCLDSCPADLNADCKRDGRDIQLFTLALVDPAGFDASYIGDRNNANVDGNCVTDVNDIPGFVTALLATLSGGVSKAGDG